MSKISTPISTSKRPKRSIGTLAVHAGWEPDSETGAVMPPICMTSTYVQDAPGQPRNGFEYSRTQNVTRFALQDALTEIEGGACGFTFTSGMAAIHTLLLTFKPGDRIVAANDLYGGTHRLFSKVMSRFGLIFDFIDTTVPEQLQNLPADTRLLYLETPSNPLLNVTCLESAVAAAKKVGAEVAVDNTFATPYLQSPFQFGADYVVHSTTKYIAGHSDVVGGALIARNGSLKEDLWFHQNSAGTVNSPFDSFLTLRGLRTLHVRMDRHCQNAQMLAEFLETHPTVDRVIYPGLASHRQHHIAKEQMNGFGGMVGFELPGGVPQATEFTKRTKLFSLAESLGGVESLVELPAPMTHASVPPEKRKAIGIADGLVRLSVGIEDGDDLLRDLEQALKSL
jgi:cystathionine gamma-lyase